MKLYFQRVPFAFRLTKRLSSFLKLCLVCSLLYPLALQASVISAIAAPVKFKLPPPPADRGGAGNRGGAASRNFTCETVAQPLTALVPEYQTPLKIQGRTILATKVWGLTATARPTFWFYVPYRSSAITAIDFHLRDESSSSNKTIYKTSVTPAQLPGIISVNLPETIAPLQINKPYHWFFKIRMSCSINESDFAEGWVQRVSLNDGLSNQLKQATPARQAALYAENGLWHDALTTIAELRAATSQTPTLTEEWTSLLKAVGLEPLATQPIAKPAAKNLRKQSVVKGTLVH